MAVTGVPTNVCAGLRPFNPFRDLSQVAGLLARVFGPEMAVESGSAARLVHWTARFPSIGWMWMGFDAWFDGSLGGFVWVCGDRVVANASIAPMGAAGRQWVLSNVAVEGEFRGRGIGRRLVEACLDYAWGRGADQVLLQVWQGNEPARRLYESLGFRPVSRLWRLASGDGWPAAAAQVANAEGLAWRRLRGRDLGALRRVATSMMPYQLRLLRPSPLGAFEEGAWEVIRRLLIPSNGRQLPARRVLERSERLIGGLALAPVGQGQVRLSVILPPEPPSEVVAATVGEVAALTQGMEAGLLADLPESLDSLRLALLQHGFEERDALLQMSLERPYRADWGLTA